MKTSLPSKSFKDVVCYVSTREIHPRLITTSAYPLNLSNVCWFGYHPLLTLFLPWPLTPTCVRVWGVGPSCSFGTVSKSCFQELLGNWHSLLLIQQLFSCLSGCESPHFGLNSEAAINHRECQEVTLLKCRHLVCYHAITSKARRLPKLQALNFSSVL